MKRFLILFISIIFFHTTVIGNIGNTDDYIDIQYQAFEREGGEKAFRIAQAIMDSIGEPAKFDAASDKAFIKSQLLKEILLYYYMTGEFNKQLAYMEIADPYYRETGNLMDLAGCYNILGISYQRMGQFSEAIQYYSLCSEILDQEGSPMALTNKRYEINNIANIYTMMEECDQAEEMYLNCIEMLGNVGTDPKSNLDLAAYTMNLAEVQLLRLSKLGDDDESKTEIVQKAVDYAEQSMEISRQYGDRPEKMANRLITVAKAHFAADRQQEALKEVDSAMAIIKEHELFYLETAAHGVKGGFAYDMGRFDESEKYYVLAWQMAEEYHFDEFRVEMLRGAYLATKKTHPERSLVYLEKCKAWEDSVYGEEQQAMIREYQVKYQTAEKERAILIEQAKIAHDRQRITWLVVALALFIALTGLLFYLVTLRRKQNRALKHLNQTKDHVFSVVSHDIKAPLEAHAQLLDMTCEQYGNMKSDEIKISLEALKDSTHNLISKIQTVIYWVKEELRDMEPHPSSFNLHELAQCVIDEQTVQVQAKSLHVVNTVPKEWTCFDDAEIVRIVLRNLLSNAVKFSLKDGEVSISADEESGHYRIKVADKGVGINPDKLKKLLNEIASSSKGTSGELGTGIGLFVSRQLTDRIGSEMRIESVEGQGTVVSFTIKKA